VAVPDGAIQLLNGKHVVFVVKPDGKGGATFVKKEIEIHAKAPDGVQIIQGIAKGDVIVIEGAFAVKAQFEKSKLQGGEG
jgi:fructose-1-phosphate kinase PfkB-like protein